MWENSDCVFFTVIGYNSRIFGGYLILTLGNSSSFAYAFQRHNQEMTQVKLVLQNKLKALSVWLK